jgi:hypothetical protein
VTESFSLASKFPFLSKRSMKSSQWQGMAYPYNLSS